MLVFGRYKLVIGHKLPPEEMVCPRIKSRTKTVEDRANYELWMNNCNAIYVNLPVVDCI